MNNTDLLKNFCGQVPLSKAHVEIIKAVQESLIRGGYLNCVADGLVGPKTMAAFHAFKSEHNLGKPDYLGETTAKALLSVRRPSKTIKLDVEYFYQRDNSTNLFGTGDRQCKLTCSAMLAHHLLKSAGLKDLRQRQKEGGFREPESVFAKELRKYGDTIYNIPHVKALRRFNILAHYSKSVSLEGIIEVLKKNIPVPISVDYKSGGHIVLVVGYDDQNKRFWVHDPYGERDGAFHRYRDRSPLAGKYDTYSWGLMEKLYVKYWNKHALIATEVSNKKL